MNTEALSSQPAWSGAPTQSGGALDRSVETLTARKDDIAGLAVASDERIEAYLLYLRVSPPTAEIVSLGTFIEDGGARLKQLLFRLGARGMSSFRFPKVHPAEISKELPSRERGAFFYC